MLIRGKLVRQVRRVDPSARTARRLTRRPYVLKIKPQKAEASK